MILSLVSNDPSVCPKENAGDKDGRSQRSAEMSQVPARSLAALLGVKPKKAEPFTALDLSREVGRGLPASAVDLVCAKVAPCDLRLHHRIVPKATLARRQRATQRRLSPEESNRLARLAQLWAFAIDVW